jgi:hypothetical protein
MKKSGFVISFEALTALLLVFATLSLMYAAMRDAPAPREIGSEHNIEAIASDISVLSGLVYGKNLSTGSADQVSFLLYRLQPGLCARVYLVENGTGGYFDSVSSGDCRLPTEGSNPAPPIAYWTFDAKQVRGANASNSTYALDASGGGYDCIVGGQASDVGSKSAMPGKLERESCRRKGCYSFDAVDDQLSCQNYSRLMHVTASDFTIGGWIYPNPTGVGPSYVIHSGEGSTEEFEVRYYPASSTISARIYAPRNGTVNATLHPLGWHHFAAVGRGSNLSLYVDGEYTNSTGMTDNGLPYISKIYMGDGFNGTIDELKIFDRGLTAAQVREEAEYRVFGKYGFDYDLRAPFSHGMAVDESGNWNDLKVRGNATQNISEMGGLAFNFPGPMGGSSLENTTIANFTQTTVMMRIKQRSYGNSTNWPGLAARSGSFAFYSNTTVGGGLVLLVWNATGGVIRIPSLLPQVPLDEWHHVAFTYAGKNATIYLDGVGANSSDAIYPYNLTLSGTQGPLQIGTTNFGVHDFNGTMDDVRVYSRALGASEIESAYRGYVEHPAIYESKSLFGATYAKIGGLLGTINRTAAFYSFDLNATGNITNDSSPNVLNGLVGEGIAQKMPYLNRSNNSPIGNDYLRLQNLSAFYEFDGVNDTIAVPSNSLLQNPADLTVEAWVRPKNNVPANQIVASYLNSADNTGWELRLVDSGGTLNQVIRRGDGGGTSILTGSEAVWVNRWSYIAATFSRAEGSKLYRNGMLVGGNSSDTGPWPNPTLSNFTIGGNASGCATCFFNGSIDEVRLYNKSLSEKQIYERYYLRASYSFDANNSTTGFFVNDSSVYKGHCRLVNGTWNSTGGILGRFYEFNGSTGSGLNCSNSSSSSIVALGNRTVMMWFRLREPSTVSDYSYILFSRGQITWDTLAINSSRTILTYSHSSPTGVSVIGAPVTPLFREVPKNQWLHAAVSYNNASKETRVYLNGVMLGKIANDTVTSNEDILYVGRDTGGSYMMNGSMDEVKVFGRALSDSEIFDEYMSAANPNERFAVRSVVWGR